MIIEEIEQLIIKFLNDSVTDAEMIKLNEWIADEKNHKIFQDYVQSHYYISATTQATTSLETKKRLIAEIRRDKSLLYRLRKSQFMRYAAAAMIAALIAIPFIIQNKGKKDGSARNEMAIMPGTDKAYLTISNGEQIALGTGLEFKGDKVVSDGDDIVYQPKSQPEKNKPEYNYLTIPKGGQFLVTLSDDTKVWLNSESKLKYPTSFVPGKPRVVELLYGEAYFDVTPSGESNGTSFIVNSKSQQIKVLGTEFNVKAYLNEESISTTLVEGSVTIDNGVVSNTLQAGQQAIASIKTETIDIIDVESAYEVAWKNGFFMFDKEPLGEMLKTLSRWYDTEFQFENEDAKDLIFSGLLHRKNNITELLNNLEKTGEVKFEFDGNKIVIK